jgi:hypothetical protein
MVQMACIARTPEFVQLIEDLIVILLGTSRNFRWSAHRRSIVLPYRSRATYSPKSHNAAGISFWRQRGDSNQSLALLGGL